MALTYGFYNSVEGDRTYDAIQFGRIFDGLITDGIYANYEQGMAVMASENAGEVIIQPGRAWFNHAWSYNDANFVMTAPAPEVLLERIDALVLDIDSSLAARENKFAWVTGTASSKPVKPTLIHTVTHNQYALCYVHRYPETTTIKAADITNVIGRETPFVAGVLNPIDVSAYVSQWDDEFHTWEDSTRSSFEGWMMTQQEIYTEWYSTIRSQMESDLTDFESWFETIQGIIDEEAATHLQAEIDALAAMLPAGSHITVTTNEQSLYLRNVTVSDVAGHSATAKFDNTGVAVIESFPYIGNLTVTATDGTPAGTATEILPAPYFGRYNVNLAFWSATINLNGDSSVGGVVVKVKDHTGSQLSTVTLSAEGKGVYYAAFPDTYTFEYTIGGDTMEVSLNVTEETTYSVEIYAGFNWRTWCTLGGVSTYGKTSLSDVFDDEEATRKLMTVHASADYLINRVSHNVDDIDEFTVNDTAMKWIGLRDYVCDGLTAIDGVWDKFLASNYWERILKDHVPTMKSNTTPYGTAGASSQSSTAANKAWAAFSQASNDARKSAGSTSSARLYYGFNQPINVRKAYYKRSASSIYAIKYSYSDDNSTWTDATDWVNVPSSGELYTTLDDCGYHRWWSVTVKSTDGSSFTVIVVTLQFYGRSLNVSVPVMTSDTAPYGEASAGPNLVAGYPAWKAFDGDISTYVNDEGSTEKYITYQFTQDVCVKAFAAAVRYNNATTVSMQIAYSDDGTNYTNIDNPKMYNASSSSGIQLYALENNSQAHKYWKFTNITSEAKSNIANELQFYGVDYTEREFAEGSTVKYLYDHGLELEPISVATSGSATATKYDEYINLGLSAQASSIGYAYASNIDLTDKSYVRAVIGDYFNSADSSSSPFTLGVWDRLPNSTGTGRIAYGLAYLGDPGLPTMGYITDAKSITGNYIIAVAASNNTGKVAKNGDFNELWLE